MLRRNQKKSSQGWQGESNDGGADFCAGPSHYDGEVPSCVSRVLESDDHGYHAEDGCPVFGKLEELLLGEMRILTQRHYGDQC